MQSILNGRHQVHLSHIEMAVGVLKCIPIWGFVIRFEMKFSFFSLDVFRVCLYYHIGDILYLVKRVIFYKRRIWYQN